MTEGRNPASRTEAHVGLPFAELTREKRYKLLTGLVAPRPIAWITTVSETGIVNAAPYSFFNVVGDEPPLVMVSIDSRPAGGDKDTGRNIIASGEFVIHMVDEQRAAAMHASASPMPPTASEPDVLKLALTPSVMIAPPRIADAPIAFECRLWGDFDVPGRRVVLGEILMIHARPGIIDPETCRIDMGVYQPVGRLAGNNYIRTTDKFSLQATQYTQELLKAGRDSTIR